MNTTANQVLPPPTERYTILGWLNKNLFSTWYNALLTLISGVVIYFTLKGLGGWVFNGAQWGVVETNLRLFLVGQYPVDQLWRIWLSMYFLAFIIGLSWGIWAKRQIISGIVVVIIPLALAMLPLSTSNRISLILCSVLAVVGWSIGRFKSKRLTSAAVVGWVLYFILFMLLVRGLTPEGGFLPNVRSNFWGGLLLTFMLTVVGIVFSFPIGVALALGRRSSLPIIKYASIAYIELVRGVPLITILFMAQLMLPLFLPSNVTIDRVVRAMVGITLFSAAYLAENVRGGLQAIPNGQYEAAHALGLSGLHTMIFIILPQALRAVIPILVGQFISLFKDTTLVAIVGLFDLLGIGRTVLAQPDFIGKQPEVYLFISALFFVFSYVMSYLSQRLEVALGVGER